MGGGGGPIEGGGGCPMEGGGGGLSGGGGMDGGSELTARMLMPNSSSVSLRYTRNS